MRLRGELLRHRIVELAARWGEQDNAARLPAVRVRSVQGLIHDVHAQDHPLRVDVVDAALNAAYEDGREPSRTILLTPAGRQLDDALASELAAEPHLALLCGRYEGVDERVREHLTTDAVSVGPYVLSGGELAAMVIADAVIRKLPGALGTPRARARSRSRRRSGGARVSALHPSRVVPGLGRAGHPRLRRPRAGS